MYVVIYNKTRISFTEETSGVKKILQRKTVNFKIVLKTGSYIACWIPSGFIYSFFALGYKFPIDILLYTTIYITPVKSIVDPLVTQIITLNR